MKEEVEKVKDDRIKEDNFKKIAIVDYRMRDDFRQSLKEQGFTLIGSFKSREVHPSIDGHVDISIFSEGNHMIVSPPSFEYYKSHLSPYKNIKIDMGVSRLSMKYPKDVAYNICYTGKFAIGNFEHTDEKIISYLKKKDAVFIPVFQGYSNCSILVVDEESIITSDEGIVRGILKYNKENFNKIDLLKIKEGNIYLSQMSHGFIGGASALVGDRIYFFGDVDSHPDSKDIKEFIRARGKTVISLGDGDLIDYGGMVCFEVSSD